ncbi:MAG: class II aldolase/adducin family protein [Pelolinea sp.]|jgi:L-ribulose-5-phosphate 4-epimerase|nr:class II aldolase/adducin family protein [Pelolinea sp.]
MNLYSICKQQVYETTMKLVDADLIRLSYGNISMRLPDGNIAITPTSIPYDRLEPKDIVITDLDGKKIEGHFNPSSERALHYEIYKVRSDVNAVVHTHSRYAIAFSSVCMELPVICIELFFAGAPIPVAPYQCPGTAEVGTSAAAYFKKRPDLKGLLLQNHGQVAVGNDLNEAYQMAYNVEIGAEIYHFALQTGKTPNILTEEQVADIIRQYRLPRALPK